MRNEDGVRSAVLHEHFIEHLRAGAPSDCGALAAALRDAGYHLEGALIEHSGWCKAVEPWVDQRVFVGRQPPGDAMFAELWLDSVEVMPMVLVEAPEQGSDPPSAVWMAVRPVARWQFLGFRSVAQIVSRQVQVVPSGLRSLDPARIEGGPQTAPITNVTHGEARLYAGWLGKVLSNQTTWKAAARTLSDRSRSLWSPGLREWASGPEIEEGMRIRLGVDDWRLDLIEEYKAMMEGEDSDLFVGEHSYYANTGLRTAIPPPLLTSVSPLQSFEPIALGNLFRR